MTDRQTTTRYTNEAVGAFVLIALALFVAGILQSGRLRDWFEPGLILRVLLPAEGLYGLTEGAQVIILGTDAGQVNRIVVGDNQQIYAEASIKRKMTDFVRRDSVAVIRKQFGVAGAAYLEISRGTGEPLDWGYAVISAVAERAPTESIGEIIADIRAKALPIIADAGQLLANLNTITGKIAGGEGAIGRLLVEDRLARELESLLVRINADFKRLSPILNSLQTTSGNIAVISDKIVRFSGDLPPVVQRAEAVLASLQAVMQDLGHTTPQLPKMVENANDALSSLPVLLLQTQQVVSELELLIKQLRSNWLLGGNRSEPPREERISPMAVPR